MSYETQSLHVFFFFFVFETPIKNSNCLAYQYQCRPKFYNWLPVLLEKVQTTCTNQNFVASIFLVVIFLFPCDILVCFSLLLPYLASYGLIFSCFSLCGDFRLLLCLKSLKHKARDLFPSLMWNCHKSYLYISAITFG